MLTTLFDHSLTYQRQQLTRDASGGARRAFVTLASALPCSAAPASSSVVADYARRDMLVSMQIYTSADLNKLIPNGPQLGDRLLDGAAIYLVKGIKRSANAAVSNEAIWQIEAEERVG